MSSRNVLLADAIVARLNGAPGGTFVVPFVSRSVMIPYLEIEKATALAVLVAFGSDLVEGPYTRAQRLHTITPQVIVVSPVAAPTDANLPYERTTAVDQLIELAEQIADYMPTGLALGSNEAKISNALADPIYDPDELQMKRRFLSVIRLTALTT